MLSHKKLDIALVVFLSIPGALALAQFFFVGGYPQLNDIIGVLRISSFDNESKWVNGFFGPGYTYLSNLIGTSVLSFGVFYVVLLLIFTLSIVALAIQITRAKPIVEKIAVYSAMFLLISFTVFRLRLNYTDGIFLLFLFVGLCMLFWFLFVNQKIYYLIASAIFLGVSVLFRHHGFQFLAILFLVLGWLAGLERIRNSWPRIFLFSTVFLLPTFCSIIHLAFVGALQSWQVFNLYKFFYGVNWHEIDLLLQSQVYKEFSLSTLIRNDLELVIKRVTEDGLRALVHVLPFLIATVFLCRFQGDRKLYVFIAFFLLYTLSVLPGWGRGVYPLYGVFCFFLAYVVLNRKFSTKLLLIPFFIVLLLLARSSYSWVTASLQTRSEYKYVTDVLEPTLKLNGIKNASEVFSDDFNLFLYDYDVLNVCSFRGWVMLHPNYRDRYNPRQLLADSGSKDCPIKVVIARKKGYIESNKLSFPFKEKVILDRHVLYLL